MHCKYLACQELIKWLILFIILSIDGDFLGIQDPNMVLYTTPYRARLANSTNNINITGNTNVKNPYPSKNLNTTQ